MEVDLLLVDGEALVVVGVKSTLRVDNVCDLPDNLKKFPRFFPEYRGYRLFGAVAALNFDESSECYAYRRPWIEKDWLPCAMTRPYDRWILSPASTSK